MFDWVRFKGLKLVLEKKNCIWFKVINIIMILGKMLIDIICGMGFWFWFLDFKMNWFVLGVFISLSVI